MSHIRVLDCTLRDGGYCNNWLFGSKNINRIMKGLSEAHIDYIECGYLSGIKDSEEGSTIYNDLSEIERRLPSTHNNSYYVCMLNYGEFNIDELPQYKNGAIKGIRLAFHKKDSANAIESGKLIIQKGYQLFVQPMISLNYSDEEFIELIHAVNEVNPYAFYIVDSFGIMKRKDLIRLFYMVEHNLKDGIAIGYHSHNNMQLAYSNAQSLADIQTKRDMIIDSSIYGMGRGAGNLNTELFVEYLNDNIGTSYYLKPLLVIIDEILTSFYQQNYWGYSLSNYLSAKHNAHPNYARYLDEKNTLTYEAMDEIFSLFDGRKKTHYDKEYIESLYTQYLETGKTQVANLEDLQMSLKGKDVLLIAPGKSASDEEERINSYYNANKPIAISVNFDYTGLCVDYIFVSNLRRFNRLETNQKKKSILTSNIPSVTSFAKINYSNYLNDHDMVRDNAGLMLIKFLIETKVKKIYLAGMDGYSFDSSENYVDNEMTLYTKKAHNEAMNTGMQAVLRAFSQQIPIEYVTTPKFINV